MYQFDIILRSFQQVQDFVALALKQPFDVMVGNDSQNINGKDLLGMFSLDYSRSLKVTINGTQEEFVEFRQEAARILGESIRQ